MDNKDLYFKKHNKILICAVFMLIFNLVNAQIQILDSLSSSPVPFARIKVENNNNGLISDFNGIFYEDTLFINADSINISCIGYETKRISIKSIVNQNQVFLMPIGQQLAEVNISTKKIKFKEVTLGISKKPKSKFFDPSVTAKNGTIRAVYIPNVNSSPAILKSVNIFITELGTPDAFFRLHVYATSTLEIKPDTELTTTNIICSGTTGNEWVKVDLGDQRIVIPENGCFIGIEWFDSPKSFYFQDTLRSRGVVAINGQIKDTIYERIRSGNGMVLGSRSETYKNAKNMLWYRTHLSNDWVNWCTSTTDEKRFKIPDTLPSGHVVQFNENNIFYEVPCINVRVSFSKEKIKTAFEPPKKRKLNSFERVKEDSYSYPQASVKELFHSLVKAVGEDNIIYILKYLCVYAEDELNDILETIYENDNGEYFSISDRDRIINHFEMILSNVNEQSLTKIDSHHFELNLEGNKYNLQVENGKWKINPYSYRVMKY